MPFHRAPQEILLNPGDYAVGDRRCRMRTVLGSCVSITLWHPQRCVGAMSHFLLASRSSRTPHELDARYGDEAMILMLRGLGRRGVAGRECQAKIFGGGNMFPDRLNSEVLNVGRRNGESARYLLQEHGIAIHSESLFGEGHRQIIFDVATGDVWSRQLPPSSSALALEAG